MGKIVYVIGSLGRGGAETQLLMLMRGLKDSEFASLLFVLERQGDLREEVEAAGIPITDGGYDSLASRLMKPPLLARALFRLWRLLRRQHPDVVHGVLPLTNLFAAVAGRLAAVPLVITSRRALNTHQDRVPGWRYADMLSARLSDLIVANSMAVKEDTVRREGGGSDKIKVIHNGIDAQHLRAAADSRERARASLGLGPLDLVLIVVANLIPYKGHAELLDALARLLPRHPRLRLLVVGEDRGIGGTLREQADLLGVSSSVKWLGLRRDIPALLAAADIYISASHEEGFSNALLEAMAAGKPVVATRVGGNVEMLDEGTLGLLAAPGNPSALADAIERLLQDPKMRAGLGARAARQVAATYSPGRMRDHYLEIYRSGVGGDNRV